VHTELEQYHQQFEQITREAQELAAGLTEARFNWRPAEGAWSIQECLAHLVMVGQVEASAIEAAIDQARANGMTGEGPFEYPAWERFILRETEPPVREPVAAPKRFVPVHGQPVTGILPTFLHVQRRFQIQIERADGLDLRRVKVATPITKLIKLSLGITLAQAAAHERRHLAQARRVRSRL
jgi:DinB family protein